MAVKKAVKKTRKYNANIKYPELIEAANKKWEDLGPIGQKVWVEMEDQALGMFLRLWNCIKRIESEYHINTMGILRDEWQKQSFKRGQDVAKKYKEHGMKELYEALFARYEGISNSEWVEFNDNRLLMRKTTCPPAVFFRKMGKTDKELKEISDVHCTGEKAFVDGFNSELECAGIPMSMVVGAPHCTYFIEYNKKK